MECTLLAKSSMLMEKIFSFNLLVVCLVLQGCMTTSIVMNKAIGTIDSPTNIESAHFDRNRDEYFICISETFNKHTELFTIVISEKIIANNGDNRGSITKINIKDETKSHWWGYEDRKDLHVYSLKTRVDNGCKPVSKSAINLPVIKAKELINSPDGDYSLYKFKGSLIQNMLKNNTPFSIFISSEYIPSTIYNTNPQKFSPCGIKAKSCLLIIGKSAAHKDSRVEEYTELLTIEKLYSAKYANALWYLALPFSIPIDISIDLLFLLIALSGPRP